MYDVPLVKPFTVIEEPLLVPVTPSGVDTAVYNEITEPPLNNGAVKETVAVPFPGVADTPVGAFATVKGITADDGLDGILLPVLLIAIIVKVYDVPLVNPETVIGELLPDPVILPGLDITVYNTTGDPPLFNGAVKETVAVPLLGIGVPVIVGGLGNNPMIEPRIINPELLCPAF